MSVRLFEAHFPADLLFLWAVPPCGQIEEHIYSLLGHVPPALSRWGFPGGSGVKNPLATAGDAASIPGLGRSPGEGNGNPLQHSCLENPIDRGAWQATIHGVAKSPTWLSDWTRTTTKYEIKQWELSSAQPAVLVFYCAVLRLVVSNSVFLLLQ